MCGNWLAQVQLVMAVKNVDDGGNGIGCLGY